MRPGERHRALSDHHRDEVGERRDVGGARRAGSEHRHLDEGPLVAEEVDPLARRQLSALVLEGDLLLAPAELRVLPPPMQVLDEVLHPRPLAALDLVGRLGGLALVMAWSVALLRLLRLLLRLVLGCHQRPFHSGSRFSKKALTPSWMSSVEKVSESCER